MLEGSDAKTETVRGLLLPSPMTVRARGWGSGLPQLSALASTYRRAAAGATKTETRGGLTKPKRRTVEGG